ncbi:hypothetical protein [Paenibacillus aestuarii]|uniref:Uncharacterized protein n=1 Tax=Paenibacillus aestuarii TaxID=516965 RepID=A0ABW0K553_9BACL|nr:hypothetical protein [Paenibacillus aestuarii]
MRKQRFVIGLLFLSLMVTGCGNRGIPAIKQELMDKKMSVLMLTSASLSDPAEQTVSQTLLQWRDSNQIAFDWVKDLQTMDDSVAAKLKSKPYDYIYVIGNELLPAANPLISQNLTTGKWTLMQNQLDPSASGAGGAVAKAAVFQIDPAKIDTLKNQWVSGVLATNTSVEWVTRADRPIPSAWAPSEEADHIVLLDNNQQWFQQLSLQTKQHASSWIIFNAATDAAHIQKAKTLGVSVMDLSDALSADLDWTAIMNNRLNGMLRHTWQSGATTYSDQELKELKLK